MDEESKLSFKTEEEREQAFLALPDEPPPGVNVEEWQDEQEEKAKEILSAEITGEDPGEDTGGTPEEKPDEAPSDDASGEDELIDFTKMGKIKRSELPENLRHYANPREILKQADHARKYANTAEEKLSQYQAEIAELKATAQSIPKLENQIEELKKAMDETSRKQATAQPVSKSERKNISSRLLAVKESIEKLKSDGEDVDTLSTAFSGTIDAFNDTFTELDSVRSEFSKYKQTAESRLKNLEERINSVSSLTQESEERRKAELEMKNAITGLSELQKKYPELGTTKPLYSNDRRDVETSIVKMAKKVFGGRFSSQNMFDDINRFVGAFNAGDAELKKICENEGISPGDYGLTPKDIRNYGILMDIYWRQRGERIDAETGKRIPVKDFRGKAVTFPDFESVFRYIKDSGGITDAERELSVIEAEKNAQKSLSESLSKRDTSSPTLEPTGVPPEGPGMTEDEALKIVTELDEETMERLLRVGDARGWAMFEKLKKAHEKLEMPVPEQEAHWKQSA